MKTAHVIGRWNYNTREYEPYVPDPNWTIIIYTHDMDRVINCTNCGCEMVYGEGLTSKELHTAVGLGYPVCQPCYDEEIKRWKEDRERTDND